MEDIKDLKKESSFEEIIKMEEQHLIQYHEFSSQTDKNKVSLIVVYTTINTESALLTNFFLECLRSITCRDDFLKYLFCYKM